MSSALPSPSVSSSSSLTNHSDLTTAGNLANKVLGLKVLDFKMGLPGQKQALIEELNTAYVELRELVRAQNGPLSADLRNTAATIFYLYGRALYGGDMIASKQPILLALALQLENPPADLGGSALLKSQLDYETLPEAATYLGTTAHPDSTLAKQVNAIGEKLNGMDETVLKNQILNMDEEHAFDVALALRWLGATWHNLEGTRIDLPRLKKMYDVAEAVARHLIKNARIRNPNYEWLVADIIYNTRRGMHLMAHPGDTLGELRSFKELHDFLDANPSTPNALEMSAQTHNMTSLLISKLEYSTPDMDSEKREELDQYGKNPLERLRCQYNKVVDADSIAENGGDQFNPFLKVMFKNNRVGVALCVRERDPEFQVSLEQIGKWNKVVTDLVDAVGYQDGQYQPSKSHYYHAMFCLTAARYACAVGNFKEARKRLELGLVICAKFEQSTASIKADILQFLRVDLLASKLVYWGYPIFQTLKFPLSVFLGVPGDYKILGTRVSFIASESAIHGLNSKATPLLRRLHYVAILFKNAVLNLSFNTLVDASGSAFGMSVLFNKKPFFKSFELEVMNDGLVGKYKAPHAGSLSLNRFGKILGQQNSEFACCLTREVVAQISLLAQMKLIPPFLKSLRPKFGAVAIMAEVAFMAGVTNRLIHHWARSFGHNSVDPNDEGFFPQVDQKFGKLVVFASLVAMTIPAYFTGKSLVLNFQATTKQLR